MEELRLGVIGATGRGATLGATAHQPENGARVVAVCNLNEELLEHSRKAYGPQVFTTTDYRELLKQDLHAVFVTTPDWLHERMAIDALEAGKAVYLEKPMAISTGGCDRILETAFETKSRLYVGHNMRHMAFVIRMKELIEAGEIGEVKAIWCRHFVGHGGEFYFKDWHADRRYSNSLLLQKAAHDIDIIHWLAGGYSKSVHALGELAVYGEIPHRAPETDIPRARLGDRTVAPPWPPETMRDLNPVVDVEDLSMMQMRLNNGVLASYQQCHFTPDYWRNYTVIGTRGRIENFGNGGPGTTVKMWNRRHAECDPAGDACYEIPVESGGHGGSDPRIVNEFLRFVREGGVTQTSPLAARYSVAAGCAAADSLRNGGVPLEIAPVREELSAYFEHGQTRN